MFPELDDTDFTAQKYELVSIPNDIYVVFASKSVFEVCKWSQ